jgi:beta-lysine 5,6-aminomutase alpha subunit
VQKLNLNEDQIHKAREAASSIVMDVHDYIKERTTTSVERTVVRLFGVDGITEDGVPLPNVMVNQIYEAGQLGRGAAFWLANAVEYHQSPPQIIAEAVTTGKINLCRVPKQDEGKIRERIMGLAQQGIRKIDEKRA